MTLEQVSTLLIPAMVTIIGNIIVYFFVKKNIDRSIENYKISYTGIYKEKIEIHKKILKKLIKLKTTIQQYQYIGSNEDSAIKISLAINSFIDYYLINEPFIKKQIVKSLEELRDEFQFCFEAIHANHYYTNKNISSELLTKSFQKLGEAKDKLDKNNTIDKLEKLIKEEIRKDLNIND